MATIDIYTKSYCGYCRRAKKALDHLGLAYNEIEVSTNRNLQREMQDRSRGGNTVPQVFVGNYHLGGSDDLLEAIRSGRLAKILAAQVAAA